MSTFFTVEDVNGVIGSYGSTTIYHEIDTGNFSTNDFTDVKMDFCIVSKVGTTFAFEIHNPSWTGAYYVLNSDKEPIDYINVSFDSETNTLTVDDLSSDSVTVVFACNNIFKEFNLRYLRWKLVTTQPVILEYDNLSDNVPIEWYDIMLDETDVIQTSLDVGVNHLESVYSGFYRSADVLVLVKKIDYDIRLSGDLITGKPVTLRIDTDLIAGQDCDCRVSYLDQVETFRLSDGFFSVDLTGYTKTVLPLTFEIFENDSVLGKSVSFNLKVTHLQVSTFDELYNEIISGASVLELADDISFNGRINVNHDLLVYGNGCEIDFNEYGFSILNDCVFKLKDCSCVDGDTSIIQNIGSKVELDNCKFTNCKSSNYNNLGSVIYCDVDLESLSDPTDFTTRIINCTFTNNHNTIFHGGELLIDNCKFHNTDPLMSDNNNPAFLYQTDGDATISNSIFDIDYDENNTLCENETNSGFSQCIFQCGETAIINNVTHNYLQNNNFTQFLDNNKAHVYMKYYYPAIETCVYSSPIETKEDTSYCYCISGDDHVYKQNVQVTRVDTDNQNTKRIMTWEDI